MLLLGAARAIAQTQGTSSQWFEEFERRFPPTKKNAAAADVERLALALGIELHPNDPDAEHPTKEDADAYTQAGFASWLDAQVKTSDDFIAPAPAGMRVFLESHQSSLASLAGRLQKETPDFGYDPRDLKRDRAELVVAMRLNRILLSDALVEERAGRHLEAEGLLEAAWSLSRSFSELPDIPSQLISIAMAKLQVGVLRKMSEPAFEWDDRLSADHPWQQMIDSFEGEAFVIHTASVAGSGETSDDAWVRGWRAVASSLREISPCRASKLSDEEFSRPFVEVVKASDGEAGGTQASDHFQGIMAPNVLNALRRSARLAVDRELTAKILEIRQEKAALRPSRWPEKFADTESRICPGESYQYQVKGAAFAIRFKGSIADPGEPALVLPLSFEARPPKPTPTPTRTAQPNRIPSPRP